MYVLCTQCLSKNVFQNKQFFTKMVYKSKITVSNCICLKEMFVKCTGS